MLILQCYGIVYLSKRATATVWLTFSIVLLPYLLVKALYRAVIEYSKGIDEEEYIILDAERGSGWCKLS